MGNFNQFEIFQINKSSLRRGKDPRKGNRNRSLREDPPERSEGAAAVGVGGEPITKPIHLANVGSPGMRNEGSGRRRWVSKRAHAVKWTRSECDPGGAGRIHSTWQTSGAEGWHERTMGAEPRRWVSASPRVRWNDERMTQKEQGSQPPIHPANVSGGAGMSARAERSRAGWVSASVRSERSECGPQTEEVNELPGRSVRSPPPPRKGNGWGPNGLVG